jgi:hypothetical protein
VDELTFDGLIKANLAAMGIFDWAALLFATSIAALAVVGELKVRCMLSLFSRLIRFVHGSPSVHGAVRILHCAPSQLRTPGTS